MLIFAGRFSVNMNRAPSSVKTVDRLVKVLDAFGPEQPTWSLAELSAHLGLPKSTLHRFLVGLETHGILRRDLSSKRWCLGYRLAIWGNLAADSTGLRQIARPVMQDLVNATGETAILTVYDAKAVICIDKVETNQAVRLTLEIGTRRCPHAGASSKILMAHLPNEEIQAILREKGLPKLCSSTLTDTEEILAELARIREQGFAESYEETDKGAWGVATPIRDWKGVVIAALGVAGPTSRFSSELVRQYLALCRQAACRISSLISTGRDEL
jgi:DNA-binding IclR family transcriptional regulator